MTALGPDERTLLSSVLRARPTSLPSLRAESSVQGARFDAALTRLAELGFVRVQGDSFAVADTEAVAIALASDMLADQRAAIDELDRFLSLVPALARDRQLGQSGDTTIPLELVHGTSNQWQLWLRLIAETPPHAPIAVFPDFSGLASVVLENADALRSAVATLGFSLRTITTPDALAVPEVRAQVAAMAGLGIELRTLANPHGWFYVDEGVMAALPLAWGESVPTSIAIVREPAVLAPLVSYMESLWQRARPITTDGAGWDPVLELLAQGLSDGAIASALDTSVRTVRRRIAEASDAFGVSSRFALAIEWERSR